MLALTDLNKGGDGQVGPFPRFGADAKDSLSGRRGYRFDLV
jgi:hypothetical protein